MSESNRVAGVIGGMGPEATVDFMAKVVAFTSAEADQDHIRMLIDHNPKIPSRHAAVFADGEDPAPVLAEMAVRLEAGGADFLVMPCNFAHMFQQEVRSATRIPLVSIIDETVSAVCTQHPGLSKIGILAAEGCVHAGLYQAALEEKDLMPVMQTAAELDRLMALINAIKAGKRSKQIIVDLQALTAALIQRGAQVIVAACTELPLVLTQDMLDVPLIASTDVLARKTISLARCETPLP